VSRGPLPLPLPFVVKRVTGAEARAAVSALASVLMDCVEGGDSVGFVSPLSAARAKVFWSGIAGAVERDETALWVADEEGAIRGTVQLRLNLPENQPHRAEVAKLLVQRRARRAGIGRALMVAAEEHALSLGRTTLTLDTASADAERLYRRLGWQLSGVIPRYALNPDGSLCDTSVYWKHLDQ
jgi:ribosomal protein S18 acetylase RimI-like enzyme